eukprot:CAMPEP_0202965600 /NCGR_PEP_ID=MMETSP1396-20130829/9514_1 /ASSEMBLY_ACC=CAM_ASM_000872 /TAXON_ID= /ORGANISM="Pseudokeronopsis sp., Strain Brazil" /LENGTH=112 /DNA_ID=CAMNT_0049688363 /DNA_START=1577 /DNA_END=1917 /DNA_ORIENTATION=+
MGFQARPFLKLDGELQEGDRAVPDNEEGRRGVEVDDAEAEEAKSYLSMENIIVDDESDMSPSDASDRAREEDLPLSGLSSENVIIHPENVLENAFRKLTTVGSATALVGIRN